MVLWYRLAAVAPIRPLAWEPPYASSVALKRKKKRLDKLLVMKRENMDFSRREEKKEKGGVSPQLVESCVRCDITLPRTPKSKKKH